MIHKKDLLKEINGLKTKVTELETIVHLLAERTVKEMLGELITNIDKKYGKETNKTKEGKKQN